MSNNIPIAVASMGPADHGKSTLLGYIALHCNKDLSEKYWRDVKNWEKEGKWFRRDRVYTYCFDRLKPEREGFLAEQGSRKYVGTSMVPTHIQIERFNKKYLLIDVPGHIKYINSSTRGIFQATSAILVIQAPDIDKIIDFFEEKENKSSRKTSFQDPGYQELINILLSPILVRTYGIRYLIVAISKMDKVNFVKSYFCEAKIGLLDRLVKYTCLSKEKIQFIPTSIDTETRTDINVATPIPGQHPMNWFQGPTLLNTLEKIDSPKPSEGRLLIPVETLYWKQVKEAPVILRGRILQGRLNRKQIVQVIPIYDPLRSYNDPGRLLARVKDIRHRDLSSELPWIGKLDTEDQSKDKVSYEAGNVVGIDIHPIGKYKKDKTHKYFQKGCIITEENAEIIQGNILIAELLVPSFCRDFEIGHNWVLFLYGRNKGDVRVLTIKVSEDNVIDEEDRDKTGRMVEVTLLLGYPMAYLAINNSIGDEPKDIVLRNQDSFCGGRVLDIFSPNSIEARLHIQTAETNPGTKSIDVQISEAWETYLKNSGWQLETRPSLRFILSGNLTSENIAYALKMLMRLTSEISALKIELIVRKFAQ